MNIQWYPGHMTKARRKMQEDMKLIDVCIELLDARIPMASRNPDIDRLAQGKYRLIILNKADLAGEKITASWVKYFKNKGITAVPVDSRQKNASKSILSAVADVSREKREKDLKKGIMNRPVKAMVVGIPNVGKSTLINTIAGSAAAKTGNKPGVTRGSQWIRLNRQVELLDTPGILWPKFDDTRVGLNLAFIGAVNDDILDMSELCYEFVKMMMARFPEKITERYGEILVSEDPNEVIAAAAIRTGCLKKGGEADTARISLRMIDDFRNGRLGRISLEEPDGE